MDVMINPNYYGFEVTPAVNFTVKNCTFDGGYHHGTTLNGKRVISGWVKRFVTYSRYGI